MLGVICHVYYLLAQISHVVSMYGQTPAAYKPLYNQVEICLWCPYCSIASYCRIFSAMFLYSCVCTSTDGKEKAFYTQ